MNEDLFATIMAVLVCLVAVAAIAGIAIGADIATCDAQTHAIGYPHAWSLLGGCQIEVTPGQWIPLENWRYMGQD